MAKFYGEIGFGSSVETAPGVWEDVITVRPYYGDILRNTRSLDESSEKLNDDISVSNSISIVADAYANQNYIAIRYIKWQGVRWKVSDVEVLPDAPRLLLRLGEVYNGAI